MTRNRQLRRAPSSSSSSSWCSDSSEEVTIDPACYQALKLAHGLRHWNTRVRALEELQALFRDGFQTANKGVQASMLADLLVAISCCDERPVVRDLITELVRTAEKLLPQQKRQLVSKEYKQAMMRQARSRVRTDATSSDSGSDDDPAALPATDWALPDSITYRILQSVDDPYTLARASAVCRAWHTTVSTSRMWAEWCVALYGNWGLGSHLVQTAHRARQAHSTADSPASSSAAPATLEEGVAPPALGAGDGGACAACQTGRTFFNKLVAEDPDTLSVTRPYTRLFYGTTLVWADLRHPLTDPSASNPLPLGAVPLPHPLLFTKEGLLPVAEASRLTEKKVAAVTVQEVVSWVTARLPAGRLRLPQWLRVDLKPTGYRAQLGSRALTERAGGHSSGDDSESDSGEAGRKAKPGKFWSLPVLN